MPNAQSAVPPVSLVIGWPQSVSAATLPQQLLRRLVDGRLSATWAIEEPEQLTALRWSSGKSTPIETALLIPDPASLTLAEAIDRGLQQFQTAGQTVAALCVGGSLPRGMIERRLCQAGVRAIVSGDAAGSATVARMLPFGVWEFGPHIQAPRKRRWFQLLSRSPRGLDSCTGASPSVVSIDLGRVTSARSRAWREVERLVDQAAEANRRGHIRIVTIGRLTGELSDQAVARPQRSILRAVA